MTRLFRALAELYVAGVKFNARPLAPAGVRRVPLPTYPFENKDYHYTAPALPADTGLAEPIALPRPKTHGHEERADGGGTQPPRVADTTSEARLPRVSEEEWLIARHQRRVTSSLLLQALEGLGGE